MKRGIEIAARDGNTVYPCPPGLSKEAQAWWKKLSARFRLMDEHLLVLEQAMQAYDRMQEARSILKKDGQVSLDRFKQPKQHPACLTERDSRFAMLRCLKVLGIETCKSRLAKDQRSEAEIDFGLDADWQ